MSKATWESILSGGNYEAWAPYEYEGEKFDSYWRFAKKTVSISAKEGRECLIDEPVSELIIREEHRGTR